MWNKGLSYRERHGLGHAGMNKGINTNVEFQKALVTSEEFREDTHHTKFIEDVFMKKEFATL